MTGCFQYTPDEYKDMEHQAAENLLGLIGKTIGNAAKIKSAPARARAD